MSNSDLKVKIFAAYFQPWDIIENDIITPIQCGRSTSDVKLPMIGDDTGDNISDKNYMYNEITAQYWAWKNDSVSDYDYIGLMHYRRLFNFTHIHKSHPVSMIHDDLRLHDDTSLGKLMQKYGLTQENVKNKIQSLGKPDIFMASPWLLPIIREQNTVSSYFDYHLYNSKENCATLQDIIHARHPEYTTAFEETLRSNQLSFCNMFIMKKALFDEYSKWLFDILFSFCDVIDLEDILNDRICGYLSELLLNVFVRYQEQKNKIKKSFLEVVLIEEEIKPIQPTYNDSINIVLACDNNYVKYTMTLIESILHKSNVQDNYEIIILGNDLSEKSQFTLKTFITSRVTITIFPIHSVLSIFDKSMTLPHITKGMYARLFIPLFLYPFKKVISLDIDMICNHDMRELFNIDLKDKDIGAVSDYFMQGVIKTNEILKINNKNITAKDFVLNYLGLKNISLYFNSGLVVWNLENIDKKLYYDNLQLALVKYEHTRYPYQDILNHMFQEKVHYIDMTWNYLFEHKDVTHDFMYSTKYIEYKRKRPYAKIIHYAGIYKPWLYPQEDFAYLWSFYNNKVNYHNNL